MRIISALPLSSHVNTVPHLARTSDLRIIEANSTTQAVDNSIHPLSIDMRISTDRHKKFSAGFTGSREFSAHCTYSQNSSAGYGGLMSFPFSSLVMVSHMTEVMFDSAE